MPLPKTQPCHQPPRRLPPEAYGDFDVVSDEQISELRQRIAQEHGVGTGEWDVIEDAVEH